MTLGSSAHDYTVNTEVFTVRFWPPNTVTVHRLHASVCEQRLWQTDAPHPDKREENEA